MRLIRVSLALGIAAAGIRVAAQQAAPPAAPAVVAVRPIDPPATPLPAETATAAVTKFAFIAYGDTRSSGVPDEPGDGDVINPEHSRVVDRMIVRARDAATTPFPVRFVLSVRRRRASRPERRDVERQLHAGHRAPDRRREHPVFFSLGNHDVTSMPAGDPGRALGLHNSLTAMSKLIPAEGSPRRLERLPTYAFGFGNAFFIAFDSNIAADPVQLAWVADQLEHLDRARYHHVIAFCHHPAFSSGPHGGASAAPAPGTGAKAPDRLEPQTLAMRALYMPLFRKHHVRMLLTGHDHLFDHWVERYTNDGASRRIDCIVTGGGGAPRYGYAGEPDLRSYLAANAPDHVQVEHLIRPGLPADNPHHFVVVQVDGDRLSLEVIGSDPVPYRPYGGGVRSTIDLQDRAS